MSMMEIYNEAVYDLLGVYKEGSKKSLDIRQTPSGGTNVPGVEEVSAAALKGTDVIMVWLYDDREDRYGVG